MTSTMRGWTPHPAAHRSDARALMTTSPRYVEALGWAEQLHRHQRRRGKSVPFLSHLLSVSAMVWEDAGDEDQAIAGLLHDAIEDAGQSHASIAERFGGRVADMVRDCTDPGKVPGPGRKAPWLERKRRFIATLAHLPEESLLVTAADKAHNCRDRLLDAGLDPACWDRLFSRGFEGLLWYFWSLHQELRRRLPGSRSVAGLGDSVGKLLGSGKFLLDLPAGTDPEEWVAGYVHRAGPAAGGEEPGR
jgi:hypothetical protein